MLQIQDSNDKILHDGVLPRYKQVMDACADAIPKSVLSLLVKMFEKLNDEMLILAEKAQTNEMRSGYLEVLHTLRVHREEIQGRFHAELYDGFTNFENGGRGGAIKKTAENGDIKLALVEKNDQEQILAVSTIVNKACNKFLGSLYTLNRRLAVVNGGTKIGEMDASFPCGPRHLCNAFLAATEVFEIDPKIKVDVINLFDFSVVSEAADVYTDFNEQLVKEGVLPNLLGAESAEITVSRHVHRPNQTSSENKSDDSQQPKQEENLPKQQQSGQLQGQRLDDKHILPAGNLFIDSSDEAIGEDLFQDVREAMARRHQNSDASAFGVARYNRRATGPGDGAITGLIKELNTLQQTTATPVFAQRGSDSESNQQPTIDEVRNAFDRRLAQLTEINKKQDTATADTDIIDIVGLLFKYILDDETMSDAVKATLSHLHTPYLKIALLDKKFFMRNEHPARKLLNAMSKAGSGCSADDVNDQGIVVKIQAIVDRLLKEFNENIQLFSELLEEFSEFMEVFNRRAALMEKRAVEVARGRDKLENARKKVSDEIVSRCTASADLPKVLQDLLLNSWANYLVISLLRNGEESIEWNAVLDLTDDLIWTVQPKKDEIERHKLRERLPKLLDSVRVGLELTGVLEVDVEKILSKLDFYHQAILTVPQESAEKVQPTVKSKSSEEREREILENMPKDWKLKAKKEDGETDETGTPEFKEKIILIKQQQKGAWFEFNDKESGARKRGKLSWYNQNTLHYMFVNQSGRQVAVKTLYDLAHGMLGGEIKILPTDKSPLITRAFSAIHRRLKGGGSK